MSTAEKSFQQLQDKANEKLNEGYESLKESGNDWLKYVEKHPMQTLLFGIIGYFALKGIVK